MRSAQPNYILSRTGKVFITNLLIYFYESFVSKYSLSAFFSVEYEILRNLWRNIILKWLNKNFKRTWTNWYGFMNDF